MCVIFIAINKDPAKSPYRICLASNRDEYFARPSLRLHRWDKPYENIVGGRDGQHQGTWFAISLQNGRIGALLNLRDRTLSSQIRTDKEKASRGTLIPKYLTSPLAIENFVEELKLDALRYDPFVLVMLEPNSLGNYDGYCFSNKNAYVKKFASTEDQCEVFAGFGNSHPDKPYMKVTNGLRQFTSTVNFVPKAELPLLRPADDPLCNALLNFLSSTDRHYPDETLVNCFPIGFPDEFLEALSSVNVQAFEKGYGTRAQTLLMVDFHGNCCMLERETLPLVIGNNLTTDRIEQEPELTVSLNFVLDRCTRTSKAS